MKKIIGIVLLLLCNLSFSQALNVCHFFKKHPDWYWTTLDVQQKWGVPVSVQVAIMQQESHFYANAVTPRAKLFGVIPWLRQSTAEGFSQALDGTWHRYIVENNKISADRTDFADAADFLGWYVHLIRRNLYIKKDDAFHLYLAYHEGVGGYRRHTYWHKPFLIFIAHQVSRHAQHYHAALHNCAEVLPQKPWWRVW